MSRAPTGPAVMLLGLIAALGGSGADAHEFWIEPSTFRLEDGERVGVRLCVGDGFEGWSLARSPERIEKFVAAGPAGELPIVGLDGADPAGAVRLALPGDYVIAYRSNRAVQVLPSGRFEQHLRDKGLDRIVALRSKRGGPDARVREAYSRHAKALIRVRDPDGGVIDRPMGLELELVADPDLLRGGADDLRGFRLLYRGKPLAGALVVAARPGTADEDVKTRSDADGRARFRLHAPGMWRVAAVHMVAAPRNVSAEWESLWASLTFEIPPRSVPAASRRAASQGASCRNRIPASA